MLFRPPGCRSSAGDTIRSIHGPADVTQTEPERPAHRPASGKTSTSGVPRLAIAALVVALIPCCPLTGFLGALLGVISLRRIRRSGGRIGGTRVALAAVVAGAASAFIWTTLIDNFVRTQETTQRDAAAGQIATLISAAQDDRLDEARGAWPDAADGAPTEEELAAFGRATLQRYGPFSRFAISSTTNSGTLFSPGLEVAGVFHFQHRSPLGSALFTVQPRPNRFSYEITLTRLIIEDQSLGDLELGVSPTEAPEQP
jgi:hypothetical protein